MLNRCHRLRRFVYHRARFSPDRKSIEVSMRPRTSSLAICSRCHQPAPGYDELGERRFELSDESYFMKQAFVKDPHARRSRSCAAQPVSKQLSMNAGYLFERWQQFAIVILADKVQSRGSFVRPGVRIRSGRE